MLNYEHVAAGVFSHWADQFPLPVTTVYPGTRIDTSGLTEWLEIGIDRWADRLLRGEDKATVELSVFVHVFVKPGVDKSRVFELADAVRQTLADQQITLHDHETSGTPVVGYATLSQAEIEDRTRRDTDAGRHGMQHVIVRVAGVAHEA
jgi:hypothetical protein